VTVPGVRVASVRRTVLVAGALLAGQALLCAVIGVVTFGERGGEPADVRVAGPRFAPPPVAPSAPGPSPTRSAAAKQRGAVRSSMSRPVSPPAGPPSRSSSPAPREAGPVASQPPAVTTPPEVIGLPPPPSAGAPAPPVVNEPCDTEGLIGMTVTGQVVRCAHGLGGMLRWRPV
jgi:hypothetical protein